ncbi:hypothetical protein [Deinococcus sp.]|uniref:hypothetical protein n=1 Tax=Deinococcus sp. TaxID=47478 RepID=UPI003B5B5F69
MNPFDPGIHKTVKANTLGESVFNAVKVLSGCTLGDLHALFQAVRSDKVTLAVGTLLDKNIIFQMSDHYYVLAETFPAEQSRKIQA